MIEETRRSFLKQLSAAAAGLAGGTAGAGEAPPAEKAPPPRRELKLPAGVKITAITSTRHTVRHPRKIGRNSFRDHVGEFEEPLVRVETSAGVEGIGNTLEAQALGKTLDELIEARDGRLVIRAEARGWIATSSESVLLDLAGKLTGRPAAELLGSVVRREVPCYDGSIYMRDLDEGEGAIRKDVENGLAAGHRAFKIKIGRGHWLKDRALGYDRDLSVIRLVHRLLEGRGQVMVDANNFYSLEESLRLVAETADLSLYWMEEMFSEERANFDRYRKLRAAIKERKLETFLADGESGRGDGDLLELLKEGTIQVTQPDIRTLGIFAFREYAEQVRPFRSLVGPHTWAKQLGVVEACLLGMVAQNFTMVEDCRLASEVLKLPSSKVREGMMTLDQRSPGLGLAIDEDLYRKLCAPTARVHRA